MTITPTVPREVQVILGVPFNNVTFSDALEWVHQRITAGIPGYIATANLDFVKQAWEDPELQRILLEADLVVADGFPIVWLSRLFGPPLKERVTGSDLVPMLAEMAAARDHSLFLLGGAPGVGEKAADALRSRYPGVRIAGQYSPPLADVVTMDHASILKRLEESKPDILLIAFGAPKQEKFANLHVRQWSVPVSIGVGGTLDFLAGVQIRAPRWVQRIQMEWFWRMMTAPRRLAKRYAADLIFLISTCWRLFRIRTSADHPAPAEQTPASRESRTVLWSVHRPSSDESHLLALLAAASLQSIALDIRGVSWFSSSGLGYLLQVAKSCRRQGHRLVLFHAGSRVKQLLTQCRLTEYLDIGDTSHEVIARLESVVPYGSAFRDGAQLIIQTPGEVTATNLDEFRDAIAAAFPHSAGCTTWIVDLRHTRFIDSSALGLFAAWRKRASENDIPLVFREAQPPVVQTFRIAKLESWLKPPAS